MPGLFFVLASLRGARHIRRISRPMREFGGMDEGAKLLASVALGDRAAMRVLYEKHHDGLFAFLRSRGADRQQASDVVQDAMLDVWRFAGRYRAEKSSAKTWIFTIARNKLIDRVRRGGRVTLVEELPESVDLAPDPEAVAMAASDASRLRACLAELKPGHLTLIRLAFFEDMTYADIGAVEDLPEGTVKTRIFHAKKLLLRCLGRR